MYDPAPSIIILHAGGMSRFELIDRICQGIEEEGIPFVIRADEETDSLRLSWKAAHASRLNVGIGVGLDDAIAVHDTRMKEDTPVFQEWESELREPKVLGVNAARLVKGLPFKGFKK